MEMGRIVLKLLLIVIECVTSTMERGWICPNDNQIMTVVAQQVSSRDLVLFELTNMLLFCFSDLAA
jgi:hypothetical protein